MSAVQLTMVRYGQRYVFDKSSIQEAAADACSDIEFNEACPVRIDADGVCIWENDGPFSESYVRLRALAGVAEDESCAE